jgi:hypothetical protein
MKNTSTSTAGYRQFAELITCVGLWQCVIRRIQWFPNCAPQHIRWSAAAFMYWTKTIKGLLHCDVTYKLVVRNLYVVGKVVLGCNKVGNHWPNSIALPIHDHHSDSLRPGRSGNRILVEAGLSAPVHTGPGVHPASSTIGTGSLSRR